ncbi:MAG: YitT family protein [Lachnospiraceae bacterium]|nr:YitT family protein [Lachnospiraceae bacterium]MBQ2981597.1 YitT family protein [Lachnospiraceae bacterium]
MFRKIKNPILKIICEYFVIAFASVFYAIGISLFLDPNKLAPGGITGIAIIINRFIDMPTGVLVLIMNVPIMIIGIWKFGLKFFVSTIVATILGSVFIDVAAKFPVATNDLLLCSLIGGILMGVSIGLIFKVGASTGGTDIIARLLKLRLPHVETGKLFIIVDIIIVLASAIAFRDIELAAYAGICVFVSGKALDFVLYGGEGARLIFVISEKEEEIAERFMTELDSGVTYVNGIGAYTSVDKRIIMCAMTKQMLPKAQDIVKAIDVNAFIIVTSANEIVGEGYKSPYENRM